MPWNYESDVWGNTTTTFESIEEAKMFWEECFGAESECEFDDLYRETTNRDGQRVLIEKEYGNEILTWNDEDPTQEEISTAKAAAINEILLMDPADLRGVSSTRDITGIDEEVGRMLAHIDLERTSSEEILEVISDDNASFSVSMQDDGKILIWCTTQQGGEIKVTMDRTRSEWMEMRNDLLRRHHRTYEEHAEALIEDLHELNLYDYLTATYGNYLGLYADGSVHVGESVGNEIAENERPIALVRCPGLANLDMSVFRDGWECEDLSDEAVIMGCCEDGDVSDLLDELKAALLSDLKKDRDYE